MYKLDRSAPRMRKGKFSKSVVTKELWHRFKAAYPEYKDMKWDDFFGIWKEIAAKFRYHAIHNPLGVKLGSYMGELKLQYLPHKFKATDYGETQKEGEEMIHLNIEDKGKVPKIKWERRWAVKFNKILQYYAFQETRDINEIAKEYMKSNHGRLRTSRITTGGKSVWRKK